MVSNVKPLPGSLGLHPRQSDGLVYWFRWLRLMFQLRLIMEIFICHQMRSLWELKTFSVMFSSFLLVVDLSIMTDESTFIFLFFVEENFYWLWWMFLNLNQEHCFKGKRMGENRIPDYWCETEDNHPLLSLRRLTSSYGLICYHFFILQSEPKF